jgi:magnesium transporter
MKKLKMRRSHKAGLPPGTLVHIGEKKTDQVDISMIEYDSGQYAERRLRSVEECLPIGEKPKMTWINIDGLHQVDVIEKAGKAFGLHPLIMEDILNTDQRPKLDDHGDYLFVVLKMIRPGTYPGDISMEQVSLVLGRNYVISFQERGGDVFDSVRERLKNRNGKIRSRGTDYLAYALIDAVVDNYFIVLEKLGEAIEETETGLTVDPDIEALQSIHRLKREMLFLRKTIWPLREVIGRLQRGENTLIDPSTIIYFRDVYDHTIEVIDMIETNRDMLSGLLDIYLSSVSNRMNEVMKVLAIFAAIFIPLTFIAGVYGMNFDHMPELHWRWGYFMAIGIMVTLSVGMLFFFRKKKWL